MLGCVGVTPGFASAAPGTGDSGPSEVAQVLGTASEIVVNEVADRNAAIVVRLAKERLAAIPRRAAGKEQ